MTFRIIEVPEGAHSELGPSSSDRWTQCLGSVLANRGVAGKPTKYAISGSAHHYASEMVRHGTPVDSLKGVRFRVHHEEGHTDVPCNGAMMHSVQTFVDRVNARPGIHPGDRLVEQMVHYEKYIPGGFGTLDDGALSYQVAYSEDYKSGSGKKVMAAWNPQLMLYGVGLTLRYGWMYGGFKKFVLGICQPPLNHFDQWEVNATDLRAWVLDVARPAALRALQPGAPFKAGPWCQFCKTKPDCRVYAAYKSESDGARVSTSRGNDFGSLD